MREDDGVADAAVDLLSDDVRSVVHVESIGVLSVEALLDVPEGSGVVVADVASGARPGEIVVVPIGEIRRDGPFPGTTHMMPPDEVIAAAAALRGHMPRGIFVGMGGAEFGFGDRLSPAVQAALAEYVTALADAIRSLAHA